MVVTNEKKSAKLEATRAKQNAKYETATNKEWRSVRKQEETYSILPVLIKQPFAVLTIRSETAMKFQIWTKFIPESLLQGKLHILAPETFSIRRRTFHLTYYKDDLYDHVHTCSSSRYLQGSSCVSS